MTMHSGMTKHGKRVIGENTWQGVIYEVKKDKVNRMM
jgi:hypothetical protein